ncbi:MAG: transposase [Brachybacterium sp.]
MQSASEADIVCDGQARALAFVLTGGQVADTSMFGCVLDEIRVPGSGPACTRPDRVLADKGYPSKKNCAWLRERGIKATIPERDGQIAKRRKRPGGPIDFGDEQQERYKGRNVVERCFSFVKQWRGLASRYDKTARSYAAGLSLSAALQWI